MTPAEVASDASILQWIIGVLAGLYALVVGHLHVRVNRAEDAMRQMIEDYKREQSEGARQKWAAIHSNRESFEAFARTVVTKEDLRDFEDRIVRLLDARARP